MGGMGMEDEGMGTSFEQYDVMNEFGTRAVNAVLSSLRTGRTKLLPDFINRHLKWRMWIRDAMSQAKKAKLYEEKSNARESTKGRSKGAAVKRFMNRLLMVKTSMQAQLFDFFSMVGPLS